MNTLSAAASVRRTTSILYDSALALLYPQSCAICGALVSARADGVACDACWAKVHIFSETEPICWKCGASMHGPLSGEQRQDARCHRCDKLSFVAARACGTYAGALRAAVLALKHEPHLCVRLVDLLTRVHSRSPLNAATLILPVPLHAERERRRGFNQAAVIARELSRVTHLPCVETCLVRTQHSEKHRAGMDVQGRLETVTGAFEVQQPRLVSGEHILLIDDVFTTGATVSSCSAVLLAAGAAEVLVLTLARPLNN